MALRMLVAQANCKTQVRVKKFCHLGDVLPLIIPVRLHDFFLSCQLSPVPLALSLALGSCIASGGDTSPVWHSALASRLVAMQ